MRLAVLRSKNTFDQRRCLLQRAIDRLCVIGCSDQLLSDYPLPSDAQNTPEDCRPHDKTHRL
jgi:hypothetical protein